MYVFPIVRECTPTERAAMRAAVSASVLAITDSRTPGRPGIVGQPTR